MAEQDITGDVLKRIQNKQKDVDIVRESPLRETTILPIKLTAKELRAICQKNSDHPLAGVLRKSVSEMPDNAEVVCDTPDIEAILTDKDVEVVTEEVDRSVMGSEQKVRLARKKLVDRKRKEASTEQPLSATEVSEPPKRKWSSGSASAREG